MLKMVNGLIVPTQTYTDIQLTVQNSCNVPMDLNLYWIVLPICISMNQCNTVITHIMFLNAMEKFQQPSILQQPLVAPTQIYTDIQQTVQSFCNVPMDMNMS